MTTYTTVYYIYTIRNQGEGGGQQITYPNPSPETGGGGPFSISGGAISLDYNLFHPIVGAPIGWDVTLNNPTDQPRDFTISYRIVGGDGKPLSHLALLQLVDVNLGSGGNITVTVPARSSPTYTLKIALNLPPGTYKFIADLQGPTTYHTEQEFQVDWQHAYLGTIIILSLLAVVIAIYYRRRISEEITQYRYSRLFSF
jgi:hypothetical protein